VTVRVSPVCMLLDELHLKGFNPRVCF